MGGRGSRSLRPRIYLFPATGQNGDKCAPDSCQENKR